MKTTESNKGFMELEEENFILKIPKDTVHIKVIADIYYDGKLVPVEKELGVGDIGRGLRLAEDYFDDPDERFVFTEKGKKYLDSLLGEEDD